MVFVSLCYRDGASGRKGWERAQNDIKRKEVSHKRVKEKEQREDCDSPRLSLILPFLKWSIFFIVIQRRIIPKVKCRGCQESTDQLRFEP